MKNMTLVTAKGTGQGSGQSGEIHPVMAMALSAFFPMAFKSVDEGIGQLVPELDISKPSNNSIFHTFDVIDRRTGRSIRMTQIGTAEQAAGTIVDYNLKGFDWETEKFLAYVFDDATEAASTELSALYPQITETKTEIKDQQDCWEEAPHKGEYLEMKFTDGMHDLEAKLGRLESRRGELEATLSNF